MHDVDRTQLESGFGEEYQFEVGTDYEYENGSSREADEMELAVDLLEVQSDEELDEFLGDLVSKATSAAGSFLRSSAGKAVTNVVKDVARKALPNIGRSVGGFFGPRGGDIGANLATRAGSMLGLELEGLSPQDQEFEVARQFVRFARTAVDEAAKNVDSGPAQVVAQQAVKRAAERYAPGLLRGIGGGNGGGRRGGYAGTGIVPQIQAIIGERPQVSPLSEVEEMELASDLLGVSNEEELEEFLGDLVKKAASAVGSAIRSPVGRQITGALRGVVKTALPAVGAAGAGFFGLPPQLGGAAGSMIANAFELETDGMDRQEQEFEVARRIVQLGATAAGTAAAAPREAPAKQVAQAALTAAAQRYAPGLARQADGSGGGGGEGRGRSGRWVRRGNKVVLYGV